MSIQLGGGAPGQGCLVMVSLEYSTLDRLGGREVYRGPVSKPGFRERRRVWWYSGPMNLDRPAPVLGADVKNLWAEVAELGARRMYEDPLATMLEGLVEEA